MEGKVVESVQQVSAAEVPAIPTPVVDPKEEAIKITPRDDNATSAWCSWAKDVKSKARSFREYAVLRTRQGISMFGEPKLGSLIKGTGTGHAEDGSQ